MGEKKERKVQRTGDVAEEQRADGGGASDVFRIDKSVVLAAVKKLILRIC